MIIARFFFYLLVLLHLAWSQNPKSVFVHAHTWAPIDSLPMHSETRGSNHYQWEYQSQIAEQRCIVFPDMMDSIEVKVQNNQSQTVLEFKVRHRDMNADNYMVLFAKQCFDIIPNHKYHISANFWTPYLNQPFISLREAHFAEGQIKFIFFWMLFYFGIVVSFIILNILIGIYFKRKINFYYSGFLIAYLFTTIIYSNRDVAVLGDLGVFGPHLVPFFAGLCSLSLSLFTVKYFSMNLLYPKLTWILMTPMVLLFGYAILVELYPQQFAYTPGLEAFVLVLLINFSIGIYMALRKEPYSMWYCISWGLCLGGFIILLINRIKFILPEEYYLEMLAPTVTHIVEMLLFTIALVKQILDIKKKSNLAFEQAQDSHRQILDGTIRELPTALSTLPSTLGKLSPQDQVIWNESYGRLVQSASNLLTYAKLERKIHLDDHSISLAALLGFLQKSLSENHPRLLYKFELDHDVLVPKESFEVILEQLLDNAKKFSEQSYTLHLKSTKHTLWLIVEDQGIGFNEELLHLQKGPFWQHSRNLTRTYQGLGLGLTLCRMICQEIKGKISLSNAPKGAIVQCQIPIDQSSHPWNFDPHPPKDTQPISINITETDINQSWILVVDDNAINRKMTSKVLDKLGWASKQAVDGQDALVYFGDPNCKCILMDLQMPVLDGFSATKAWRDMEKTAQSNPTMPIIAITAHDLDETRSECYQAGMQDLISKPFQTEMLGKILEQYIKTIPS